MNKLTFLRENGGIPASLPGEDHISGLIAYVTDLPTAKAGVKDGYSTTSRILPISSIERAEALGITADNAKWELCVLHYHLSEIYRLNPGVLLYVGLFAKPSGGAYTFAELKQLQRYAQGRIRQVGIWLGDKAADTALITTLSGIADSLASASMPLSVLLAPKVASPVASLPVNLHGTGKSRVSVIIAQDGEGIAAKLYADEANNTAKTSVSALGSFLGILSRARVHQSIGWVDQFPLGLSLPAFGDGTLLRDLDEAVIDTLDKAHYLFAVTYPDINGTYASDSHTMDDGLSDYAYLERVRTMDKAERGIRRYLVGKLSGNIYLDETTGKLQSHSVAYLETEANRALEDMTKSGELSGYKVYIDPDQDILRSSSIEVIIRNVPVGVARKFILRIGYTNKI
ncbi:DUF2586 family protein [uncultured Porphyromonas sp.]|uniref:DUF2586 family protein n=1 Tax=uncultured Porphyromonas sp. TaxID=159274 RepID=UPI002605D2F1|nr:DUF2586 family protein [uncultured Porphyromonas sp.]